MREERTWPAFLRGELRRLAATFQRALKIGTLAYATCLWALVLGSLLFDGSLTRDPLGALAALLAAAAYLLATGAVFGLVCGLVAVGRAMVGAWVIFPLAAVPAGLSLALWLGADLLADRGEALLDALAAAAEQREWLVSGVGKAAHAGPVILVIALPLLFIDLGSVLLDPGVLAALAVLVLALAGVVIAGTAPAFALSLLVLAAVYVKRLRARFKAWAG